MSKDIQIEYKQYTLPFKIVVDGVQQVTNYETPASRIFRSIHAQEVKETK